MYTFRTTEQNNAKGNDFETKSLLYLMSIKSDCTLIDTFFVDCFNDITGASGDYVKLWDVQSKNVSSLRPLTIGEHLITLFMNYISSIDFFEFILFIPKLKATYLHNSKLTEFKINNFKDKSKIREGLEKEFKRREKLLTLNDNQFIQIDNFLKQITFITDDYSKSIYIKKITNFKRKIKNENFYESIFDDIRCKMTDLKNISIHNKSVNSATDALTFNKHLTKKQLETLVINRVIGVELFKQRIPNDFFDFIVNKSRIERRDIVEECNANLASLFFQKNSDKRLFWNILEDILVLIEKNEEVVQIFDTIKKKRIPNFLNDDYTLKYLISMIKEGVA